MHSSSVLVSSNFTYRPLEQDKASEAGFQAFCPDYHEQDRVGVVSLGPEAGILHCGIALLAITTTFYDILRARHDEFFDYPQHFAFIDVGPHAEWVPIGSAWGWVDVWPNTNWIESPGTARDMLHQIFRNQINRIFWPENLGPEDSGERLPSYAKQLMTRRIKAVYYYDTAAPDFEIHASEPVMDLVTGSMGRLGVPTWDGEALHSVQSFRIVDGPTFLESMADCFEA